MELHLSAISEAIAVVKKLETELKVLLSMLNDSRHRLRVDAIFEMEFRHEKEVDEAAPIPVRRLEGSDAVDAAIDVLTCITLKEGVQSAKETLRRPGVVALPYEVISQIHETNVLRSRLESLIGTIKKSNDRRKVWTKFEAISPKQAMRCTPVLLDPQNINFYWTDTGTSGSRHVASDLVKEWEDLLDELHERRPTMADAPEGSIEKGLLTAIALLRKLGNEQVAIRRPVKPHIRARVRDGDAPVRQIISSVPFVYDIDECKFPPTIKPLISYDVVTARRKSAGREMLEDEPYIKKMNLYQYLEIHRVFGPLVQKTKSDSFPASIDE
ncbi:DNA replication terminus site-binding protein (plasmid) [Pseudomonas cannabina pv. alisalensis]|uniref:DNA replication terminus site-binding protein n=1 Tax=Pseudomonas syringae pv. maculicola str. ES4326 TaxID=629265 RepID=A0A8T8CB75_PSEYM|nr:MULTISPECIES: DNA replication terminus site-binding protein [Pseudomonas syringae group]QHF00567.1 hypothetical protein PMA4326_029095 [Pseudomonas syringae pv. maculicola str. ES4326]UBZ00550.1 DNA replication terminus site-binding protein [Pseudomonas cannabina pv. alisalensis]